MFSVKRFIFDLFSRCSGSPDQQSVHTHAWSRMQLNYLFTCCSFWSIFCFSLYFNYYYYYYYRRYLRLWHLFWTHKMRWKYYFSSENQSRSGIGSHNSFRMRVPKSMRKTERENERRKCIKAAASDGWIINRKNMGMCSSWKQSRRRVRAAFLVFVLKIFPFFVRTALQHTHTLAD